MSICAKLEVFYLFSEEIMTEFLSFWIIHPESVFFELLLVDLKNLINLSTFAPLAKVSFFPIFCISSENDLKTISSGCLRKSSFKIIELVNFK